jgi:hypothetical protein
VADPVSKNDFPGKKKTLSSVVKNNDNNIHISFQ